MGAEVFRAVVSTNDCKLASAIDTTPGKEGADMGRALVLSELEIASTEVFAPSGFSVTRPPGNSASFKAALDADA